MLENTENEILCTRKICKISDSVTSTCYFSKDHIKTCRHEKNMWKIFVMHIYKNIYVCINVCINKVRRTVDLKRKRGTSSLLPWKCGCAGQTWCVITPETENHNKDVRRLVCENVMGQVSEPASDGWLKCLCLLRHDVNDTRVEAAIVRRSAHPIALEQRWVSCKRPGPKHSLCADLYGWSVNNIKATIIVTTRWFKAAKMPATPPNVVSRHGSTKATATSEQRGPCCNQSVSRTGDGPLPVASLTQCNCPRTCSLVLPVDHPWELDGHSSLVQKARKLTTKIIIKHLRKYGKNRVRWNKRSQKLFTSSRESNYLAPALEKKAVMTLTLRDSATQSEIVQQQQVSPTTNERALAEHQFPYCKTSYSENRQRLSTCLGQGYEQVPQRIPTAQATENEGNDPNSSTSTAREHGKNTSPAESESTLGRIHVTSSPLSCQDLISTTSSWFHQLSQTPRLQFQAPVNIAGMRRDFAQRGRATR